MNDDQLQRDIEDGLRVEPSPQFAARIRTRIAASPRPTSRWIHWGVPAAGLALAALVAGAVLLQPREPVRVKTMAVAESAPERLIVESEQKPASPPPFRRSAPASISTTKDPEVLFDPKEVTALRKFVDGALENRIDVEKLIELQETASRTAAIEEIALMPLEELDPIAIESLKSGARRIEGGKL